MVKNINSIISKFPKKRAELGKKYFEIFDNEYKMNREGDAGFLGKAIQQMEEWMHKKISSIGFSGDVLEVGAGTLNHIKYESTFKNYDIVEPYHKLYADKYNELKKVRDVFSSLASVPTSRRYLKIISVATLEHMLNLPFELELIRDRLDYNGVFEVGIPSEGGFLWGLAWRLTTAVSFRFRTGLSYKKLMKYEHVNTAEEIIFLIKYYFNNVKVERWPLNCKHFSFYTYISAQK